MPGRKGAAEMSGRKGTAERLGRKEPAEMSCREGNLSHHRLSGLEKVIKTASAMGTKNMQGGKFLKIPAERGLSR